MTATVTGEKARIKIGGKANSVFAISDFSITFDRGTVEQELVGETGNYFLQGALTIDGSLTCCRFGASGNSDMIDSLINSSIITISGCTNSDASDKIGWYFPSCQITGYDISIGDASTITEASIDFTVLDPYHATYSDSTGWVTG